MNRKPWLLVTGVLLVSLIAPAAGCEGGPAASPTPSPSLTPAPTTTPTPTPSLPVLAGTPVPMPQKPIAAENAADIVELAMWGKGEVQRVTYSPDGRLLAVGSEAGIWLYDAETLNLVHFKTDGWVDSLAFTPDGTTIVAGVDTSVVSSWDVATGRLVSSLELREHVRSSQRRGALAVHGAMLAAISEDGNPVVWLWDVEKRELLHTLEGHSRWASNLAFSPDGSLLASESGDGVVRLWDVRMGTQLQTLDLGGSIFSLVFSSDGTILATGGFHLWDVKTGTHLRTLSGYSGIVDNLAFSPDGSMLASGADDGTVWLWDVRTGALRTFEGHTLSVRDVAFSPDEKGLASVSRDGTVRLWDVETGALLNTLEGYKESISGLAISPDGTVFVSHFSDNEIELWDVQTGQITRTLKGHTDDVINLVLSADGATLASSQMWDSSVWIWDTATGQCLRAVGGSSPIGGSVALSPDGMMVAASSESNVSIVSDVRTGEVLHNLAGGYRSNLVFSPDGMKLFAGSWEMANLWNIETGELLHTLGVAGDYRGGAFSPDSEMVATESYSYTVWLWDVKTGQALRSLEGHTDDVLSMAFSPDGTLLASGAEDRTVRLWDVLSGRLVRTLDTPVVRFIVFSPDGLIMVLGCDDGTVRLWGVPSD